MQYPLPTGEPPVASTRPKQWSHPPAYLREDDVEHVGRRQTVQYQEPNAAQYTQGLEDRHHSMTLEGATRRTPRSSRSASPLSQHADYVTLDEWNIHEAPADHSYQQRLVRAESKMTAPPGMVQQFSSPLHRPWEVPEPPRAQALHHSRPMGFSPYEQSSY